MLTPPQYIEAVSRLSMGGESMSIHSGTNYQNLAQYLKSAQGNSSQVNLWAPACASPEDNVHATLYEFAGGQRSFVSSFRDPAGFNWVKQTQRHISSGSLVFLRGFSTPNWLAAVGAECCVDPEFFNAHLDFLSYSDTYSIPTIPSSAKVFKLRLTSLGVLTSSEDLQKSRRWKSESMASYYRERTKGIGLPIGDSIVRKFSIFGKGSFAIEQDISICLARTGDDKWTVVVWMDPGTSLVTTPLEFLRDKGYLLPHVHRRRENIMSDMFSIATESDAPVAAHNETWGQSSRILPFQYSKPIPSEMEVEPDPFFSVLDLFEFSANSERQFLNMISSQINDQMEGPDVPLKTTVELLQSMAVSLQEHIQRLKQNIVVIKDRGGPTWPRTADKNNSVLDVAINTTLKDFESLLDDAISLSRLCMDVTTILTNSAIAEQSKELAQQTLHDSQNIMIITVLTTILLPFALMASVFSMNVEQFGVGTVHLRLWFISAFSLLVLVLSTVLLLSPQTLTRFMPAYPGLFLRGLFLQTRVRPRVRLTSIELVPEIRY
ncbi:hypothetical protein BKA65DRAFT_507504 [Rhexocercosporidium sp. MPI-PUGE-AT-0058]|nr:hypothetical protein BKA65DRAFT_507504 [Rhexocercosporidium sp. MPI-PUGE-AT-0058]